MKMKEFIKIFGDKELNEEILSELLKSTKDRNTIIEKIIDRIKIPIHFSVKNNSLKTKYFIFELSKDNGKELLIKHMETNEILFKANLEVMGELYFISNKLVDILICEHMNINYMSEENRDNISYYKLINLNFIPMIKHIQNELMELYLLDEKII